MGFRELPRRAKLFLMLVYAGGLISTLSALAFPTSISYAQPWEFLCVPFLAMLAGGQKISLTKWLKNEEAGSMSLGFAITFLALLIFGPGMAIVTAGIASLSSCVYPRRQALFQLGFNVALAAIEAAIGGLVFLLLNGWSLELQSIAAFVAVTLTAAVFYFVNTLSVALIMALCGNENPRDVWRENFLWTAPSYFATASACALSVLILSYSIIGAAAFVVPVAFLVYQTYATYVARREENLKHTKELEVGKSQLADLYLSTIKSLALAIDAKDQYTHQHILRVQRYAVAVAIEMGLQGAELEAVNTGALLHDIGKLGVPEYVLMKPGRLTSEEFDKIKKHPEIGEAILSPVEFPWPVLPVVRHHHEKWDGTGYPDGLKGEAIPLTARIMAVADVYDALTSSRSYRSAWTHERTVEMIRSSAGSHFDPDVVDAFLAVIDGVVQDMAKYGEGPLAPKRHLAPLSDSKKLARDISRSSIELWALYEVSQSLTSGLSTDETVEILLHKICSIFPGTTCAFLMHDEDAGNLVCRGAMGPNRAYFSEAATIGPGSRSYQVFTEHATFVGAYDADDLMLKSQESGDWVDLNSALIAPILFEGAATGTINLYFTESEAFSDYDRAILESIAERCGQALSSSSFRDRSIDSGTHDPLTGAYNVHSLTANLARRCSRGEPFSLISVDFDSFKAINDSFGHEKADEILRTTAGILQQTCGEGAFVARYSGDSFMVVLPGVLAPEAEQVARSCGEAIREYDADLNHYQVGRLELGLSIGVVSFPLSGKDCTSLICAAEDAMRAEKTAKKLRALSAHPTRRRKVS